MRWKLLRRRLSVSAPRMIVRSHLPWPLRWAVAAVVLGFCGAIALWAFEFGKDIAGLDREAEAELVTLRAEVARLRAEHERATAVANSAESLLRAERATQERLAQTVRELEEHKRTLEADLGFYERLLPAGGAGLAVRGLQAEPRGPGKLRLRMLLTQGGGAKGEFVGRYEVTLSGSHGGKPWSRTQPGDPRELRLRQVLRVEGLLDHPADAVVKGVQVRVLDEKGAVRATQSVSL
jgi:hypothetical protein